MTKSKFERAADLADQRAIETYKASLQLRVEEFKSLRAEIELLIKDTRSLELYAVGGLVTYYAWILTHCVKPIKYSIDFSVPIVWIIPIVVSILGCWRSFSNGSRIIDIASYIRGNIEKKLSHSKPAWIKINWETFLEIRRKHAKYRLWSHGAFWVFLILLTVTLAAFHKILTEQACRMSSDRFFLIRWLSDLNL
jgi:hypothetical protein